MSQCSTIVYKMTSELRKLLYYGLKVRSQSVLNGEVPVYTYMMLVYFDSVVILKDVSF